MTLQEQFKQWRSEGKTAEEALHDFLRTRMCMTGYDTEAIHRIMQYAKEEALRERSVKLDVMEGMGVMLEAWE